jgi:hypothetical protein
MKGKNHRCESNGGAEVPGGGALKKPLSFTFEAPFLTFEALFLHF